jgi:phage tail-like protein
MADAPPRDPYAAFRFKVEIDGLIEAGFAECSGLQIETEVEEVREGGLNDYAHRLPKGFKHVNLTLKHGLSDSTALWDWHKSVILGGTQPVPRKMVHVVVLDVTGSERWRWSFKDAYPVKWSGPDLKADTSAVAIETLELAHNGFDIKVTPT